MFSAITISKKKQTFNRWDKGIDQMMNWAKSLILIGDLDSIEPEMLEKYSIYLSSASHRKK